MRVFNAAGIARPGGLWPDGSAAGYHIASGTNPMPQCSARWEWCSTASNCASKKAAITNPVRAKLSADRASWKVISNNLKKRRNDAYIEGKRWLDTGDIGMIVPGKAGYRFLKITDRKKELLKTSLGKYIAPLRLNPFIRSTAW